MALPQATTLLWQTLGGAITVFSHYQHNLYLPIQPYSCQYVQFSIRQYLFSSIYIIVSVSLVRPQFLSLCGIVIPWLFTLQSYGSPGRHQAPVASLPIGEDIFAAAFHNQRLRYSTKISRPIAWLTASLGLPSFIARKKAQVMTVMPE